MNTFYDVIRKEEQYRQILNITPEEYRQSISKLATVAMTDTSGGRAAAQVLLSAWNGYTWQLDITDLCSLDYGLLEQALMAIRGRVVLMTKPHDMIPDGNAVMRNIAAQWGCLNVHRRGRDDDA